MVREDEDHLIAGFCAVGYAGLPLQNLFLAGVYKRR